MTSVLAIVLLIAIAVIAATGVYFWMAGTATKQPTPEPTTPITVTPIGGNKILIANLGTQPINTSTFKTSTGVAIVCNSQILQPSQQTLCEIQNTTEGTVVIYSPTTGSATVTVDTGDIDAPLFKGVWDNHTYADINENIKVIAEISDNTAVANATLYYKSPSGTWQSTPMTLESGDTSLGNWTASFTFTEVGTWQYYIIASDTDGNSRQSSTYSFIVVIAYINPTPANGSTVTSSFTVNTTLLPPSLVTLSFDGTNYTIYNPQELLYYKLDETGDKAVDTIDGVQDQIYMNKFLGHDNASIDWYGINLTDGSFDWCGGTGGLIYRVRSTITSPQAGTIYSLTFNDSSVWDLANVTYLYIRFQVNVSSTNFTYTKFCLVDVNGNEACTNSQTYTAGKVVYLQMTPSGSFPSVDPGFDWSQVDKYKLELNTTSTPSPFYFELSPLRIQFPADAHAVGYIGNALNATLGKPLDDRWCWSGSFISTSVDGTMVNPDHFSAAAWIKFNDPDPASHWYYGIFGGMGDHYWSIGFDLTKYYDTVRFRIGYGYASGGVNNTYLTINNSLVMDGNWHHIAVVFDRPTMKMYLDGVLVNSTTLDQSMDARSIPLFVGMAGGGYAWHYPQFWGLIDEFHFFNYSLSDDQVALLYKLEYGKYYANLRNVPVGTHNFTVYADTTGGSGATETRTVTVA